jgi:hypothetical protein
MACGTIPKPGTELGPCKDVCDHRDCTASRRQANTICRKCGEPIGYDSRFCTSYGLPPNQVEGPFHERCLY